MPQNRWMGIGTKDCSVWLLHAPLPDRMFCSELGSQFCCTVSMENSIHICCLENCLIYYVQKRRQMEKEKNPCPRSRVAHFSIPAQSHKIIFEIRLLNQAPHILYPNDHRKWERLGFKHVLLDLEIIECL